MIRSTLLLSDSDLERYGSFEDLSDKAALLLVQQQETWPMLRKGYASLDDVESHEFEIEVFAYRVQFNPGRITSSSAKVDDTSIRERQCFLCLENLPAEQRGIRFNEDFVILCNPFPIFTEHFTIPHVKHLPQEIRPSFARMLELAREFEQRYTVFYNGPKCGASAPDHLHFQAGSKGFMPIEEEYEGIISSIGEKIADVDGLLVFAVGDCLRKFISLESDDSDLLQRAFDVFFDALQRLSGSSDEPMMNIVASYQEGEWRVIIFPRAQHRPSFFFEEGEKRIVISPAAVDFGGVVITPVERDFHRVNEQLLKQMFGEVSVSNEFFIQLQEQLILKLTDLR